MLTFAQRLNRDFKGICCRICCKTALASIQFYTVCHQFQTAAQFIRKGLRLEYTPIEQSVVTDEKWLTFVVEQLLSNALKYTPQGAVSIYWEDGFLCIRDTGIGIAAEDLPRIFDRGYTGGNGRSDKKATGLGLYLCRRICANLGHGISAQSVPGQGTLIRLDLRPREKVYE